MPFVPDRMPFSSVRVRRNREIRNRVLHVLWRIFIDGAFSSSPRMHILTWVAPICNQTLKACNLHCCETHMKDYSVTNTIVTPKYLNPIWNIFWLTIQYLNFPTPFTSLHRLLQFSLIVETITKILYTQKTKSNKCVLFIHQKVNSTNFDPESAVIVYLAKVRSNLYRNIPHSGCALWYLRGEKN